MTKSRLFKQHPVNGETLLASGQRVPTPYHCYKADACVILGAVNVEAARSILNSEPDAHPVTMHDGSGIGALWVMDYQDTNLGPYTELVLTITVQSQPTTITSSGTYARAAVGLDPQSRLFIHRLLLPHNDVVPIAYGREVLHIDKLAADRVDIERKQDASGTHKHFVADLEGKLAVRGRVRENNSFGAFMAGAFGLIKEAGVLRTAGALISANLNAQAPARLGGGTIRGHLTGMARLSPLTAEDELTFNTDTVFGRDLTELGFEPTLVQRIAQCQFVMYPAEVTASQAKAA